MTDVFYYWDDGEKCHWFVHDPGVNDDEMRELTEECYETGWGILAFVRNYHPEMLAEVGRVLFMRYQDDHSVMEHLWDKFGHDPEAFAAFIVGNLPHEDAKNVRTALTRSLKR